MAKTLNDASAACRPWWASIFGAYAPAQVHLLELEADPRHARLGCQSIPAGPCSWFHRKHFVFSREIFLIDGIRDQLLINGLHVRVKSRVIDLNLRHAIKLSCQVVRFQCRFLCGRAPGTVSCLQDGPTVDEICSQFGRPFSHACSSALCLRG